MSTGPTGAAGLATSDGATGPTDAFNVTGPVTMLDGKSLPASMHKASLGKQRLTAMELQISNQPSEPLVAANATTKDELLRRAKCAIEAGEQSLHDAAEALGVALEHYGATQAEMARAIGKSEGWVSRLLQWHRSGYKDESPFGPRTKADRLKHAKDRAASGASKPRKPRKASTQVQAHADDAEVSAAMRKTEYAKQEAELENSTSTDAQTRTCRKPSPAEAKENLRYAIDAWWPYMDNAGKDEVTDYFLKKAKGARVS